MSLLDDDKKLEVPEGQSSYQVYKDYYDKNGIEYDPDDLPLDIETAYLPEDLDNPENIAGSLKYFESNAIGGHFSERGNTIEEINEFWRRLIAAGLQTKVKLSAIARTKGKQLKLIKNNNLITTRKKEGQL